MDPTTTRCVCLVTDMIFATKIQSTGAAVGTKIVTVSSVDSLRKAIEDHGPALVIIDLNADGVSVPEAIGVAKSPPDPPRVLAYCSHVQTDLVQIAEEAGADAVWPRSRFSAELPKVLAEVADRQGGPAES